MSTILDEKAILMAFVQPNPDGAFEGEFLQYLQSVGARHPILLLAFAPKAAGTFFRTAAIDTIDGQLVRLCHALGGRDGAPYLPAILSRCLDPNANATVGHLHMQALTANRNLLNAFGIKPVIMLRNVADMLASYLDMLRTDPTARAEGLNCMIPADFLDMGDAAQCEFMIDIIAPWYASYFATWKDWVDGEPDTVCVLRYGDFCHDPATSLLTALTHAGFTVTRSQCEQTLAAAWKDRQALRYNKGVEGRGKRYFSDEQRRRLAHQLSYYLDLDDWLPDLLGSPTEQSKAACG